MCAMTTRWSGSFRSFKLTLAGVALAGLGGGGRRGGGRLGLGLGGRGRSGLGFGRGSRRRKESWSLV